MACDFLADVSAVRRALTTSLPVLTRAAVLIECLPETARSDEPREKYRIENPWK